MGPSTFDLAMATALVLVPEAASEATAMQLDGTAMSSPWLLLFDGAVPHVALFIGAGGHLALSATCRTLYQAWPRQAGLPALGIFLDRSALAPAAPMQQQQPQQQQPPLSLPDYPAKRGPGSNSENQDPQQPPWNSLSRLLRRWSPYVETLKFTGAISGPVEDHLVEALGKAMACSMATPATTAVTIRPASRSLSMSMSHSGSHGLGSSGGSAGGAGSPAKRPGPPMPRLRRLAVARVGLFPFHADCIAACLRGPAGARLEALDLSHNSGLRDDGVAAIFKALSEGLDPPGFASSSGRRRRRGSDGHCLAALRHLDLSYTQLTHAGLRAIAAALAKGLMPRLESINLAGNSGLKDEGGMVLASMIEQGTCVLPRLQRLDATACGLGPVATRRLAEAAADRPEGSGLRGLLMGQNYVDSQGALSLAAAIRLGRLRALAHLRVDLTGEPPALALFEALATPQACPSLRRLDLGKNSALTGAAVRAAVGFGGLPHGLEELSLANCRRLGHHVLASLAQWAEAAPCRLRTLDLTGTGLAGQTAVLPAVDIQPQAPAQQPATEAAGPYLARLLAALPSLETLTLRGNGGLGAEGVIALAEAARALGPACRLRSLDVAETGLGDAGVIALGAAIGQRAFPRLQQLDVSGNAIGRAGWDALMDALSPRRMEALDASKNPLGESGQSSLFSEAGFARLLSNGLRSLKLAWTGLGASDAEMFASLLARPVDDEADSMAVDDDDGDRQKRRRPLASRLATLDLAYNPRMGTASGVRLLRLAFGASEPAPACGAGNNDDHRHALPCLQSLSLVGTGLSDAVVAELASLVQTAPVQRWLTHLELIDLRGNEVGKEARFQFQATVGKLRGRLLQESLCGYSRRLQGLVRVGSSSS